LSTGEVERTLNYAIGRAFKNLKDFGRSRRVGGAGDLDSKGPSNWSASTLGAEVIDKASKMELVQISYNN